MKDCPLLLIAQALSLLDLLYDSLGFEVHCECLGRKEIWTLHQIVQTPEKNK